MSNIHEVATAPKRSRINQDAPDVYMVQLSSLRHVVTESVMSCLYFWPPPLKYVRPIFLYLVLAGCEVIFTLGPFDWLVFAVDVESASLSCLCVPLWLNEGRL